jgi:hypothetical protein
MAEEQAEPRTWYRGAVTGWLTPAEYMSSLALHERTGERVVVDHCGPEPEAEAG